jgi:hypothetical protein
MMVLLHPTRLQRLIDRKWPNLNQRLFNSQCIFISFRRLFLTMMNSKLITPQNLTYHLHIKIYYYCIIDSNARLPTTLFDKRDYYNFAIVTFPFCVVIHHFHLLIVCISPSWSDT